MSFNNGLPISNITSNVNHNSNNNNRDDNHKDTPTARGAFGWETITDTLFMPVIIRDGRYVPIRIVETELIGKYQLLPAEIFGCINIPSFYVSDEEANLLNTINSKHCDHLYGIQPFRALSDMIVAVKDVKELARYLAYAQKLFIHHQSFTDKLGMVRLMLDSPHAANTQYPLVPYITKELNNRKAKFVPQIAIEQYVHDASSAAQMLPTNWDIAYLKMMCIYAKQDFTKLTARDCLLHLTDLIDLRTSEPLRFEIWSPISGNSVRPT